MTQQEPEIEQQATAENLSFKTPYTQPEGKRNNTRNRALRGGGDEVGKDTYYITPTHISRKTLVLMLPGGFSMGLVKNVLQLTEKETKTVWPKAAFFLSSLIERQAQRTNPAHAEDGAPVCAKVWQSLIGHKYSKRIKDAFREHGLIELTCEKDQGAKKSERYQLGPAFRNRPLRWQTILSATLARKVRADKAKLAWKVRGLDDSRRFVWDNLKRVSMSPKGWAIVNDPEGLTQTDQARLMLTARAVQTKDFWFSYDGKGDRLYHSIANAPSRLREHFLIDGNPSCELDMSCAHPFMCLALYPPEASSEKARYGFEVSSGRFYETLRDALPIEEKDAMIAEWYTGGRDSFKEDVYSQILYGALPWKPGSAFVALCRMFPVLGAVLRKRRRTKVGANELCAEMRCREASLMFGRVIPRVRAELPGCVAVTIHDALMCQRGFADDVVRIFADEAQAVFGCRPRVTAKSVGKSLVIASQRGQF